MTSHTTREERLSQSFVELADTLVNGYDVVDLLHTLAARCVELADVDAAGIMLADQSGSLRVAASSSETMRLLELLEVQVSEGPCVDSYRTGAVVAADLSDANRWPRLRAEALATGFRSVVAIPLRLRGDSIGALNLFRNSREPLDADHLAICRGLADIATIGLLHERAVREAQLLAEQLQTALNSRIVLEQAKGVLAERAGVDMDDAFGMLRAFARSRNMLLGEVAQSVIDGRIAVTDLTA